MVPGDIKGMKVRPSQATVAAWVTLLGGTNVQASATEVRDVMEKGVAEAVTFPWGSVPLLGVDKVTKYHMDAPLHTVTFQWLMSPQHLRRHVAGAEEGDRRPLHHRMGRQIRRSVGGLRARRPGEGEGAARDTRSTPITDAQLDEWKKSAEPLEKQWADNVRKAGGDPDAIMKELKQSLAQIQGGVLIGGG